MSRSKRAVGLLAVSAFLLIWQLVGAVTDPILLPTPIAIGQAVPSVIERDVGGAYLETMSAFIEALLASVVLGFVVGIATGINKYARYAIDPIVTTMYSTPGIALIPLLIFWFGIGDGVKYALVFLSVFFPIVANVQLGISEVGAHFVELGLAFGARPVELLRKVILPGVIPHVLAGLRIAAPRGFVAVLGAEMLVTLRSLGGLVIQFGNSYQTARYFVPVLLIVLTSVVLAEAISRVEHALTPWRRA